MPQAWTQMTQFREPRASRYVTGGPFLVRVEFRGLATDARWSECEGRGAFLGNKKSWQTSFFLR